MVYTKEQDSAILNVNIGASIEQGPLELQLIWLYESVRNNAMHYYTLRSPEHVFGDSVGNYVLLDKSIDVFAITVGIDLECLNVLRSFSYKYIHCGALAAFNDFKLLGTEYKKELSDIAKYCEVKLNKAVILYKMLYSNSEYFT